MEAKRPRRTKEEGHQAQLIRRRMLQRDHGNKKIYSRKNGNNFKYSK